MRRRTMLQHTGVGLCGLVSFGCVPEDSVKDVAPAPQGTIFYPPLPNPPRIQYLRTFTGEQDILRPVSDFTSFVLGDQPLTASLKQPYGVEMYEGKLYVVDTGAARISIFDLVNQQFLSFTGTGNGRMKRPINVTIDNDGTKFVCDTGRKQILIYNNDNQYLKAFGARGQFKPVDVVIADQRLYVVDIEHHQIHILDKNTGKTISIFGKAGSGAGELFHPTNIALDSGGDIYVVETSNFRVQRFSPSGESIRTYGKIGDSLGQFARPKGIAIDRMDRIYVGDAAFENIQVFDNEGQLLLFFGNQGEIGQRVNLPAGISLNYDDIGHFQHFADPNFKLDYVIFVASQFGPNKIDVFGFGKLAGVEYPS